MLNNKTIAIIGGGPGGLTLARLLQQKGIAVKVFERDANRHVRSQGATLDLHHDSGLKAIKAANLLDEFKNKYRPGADKGLVADKMGNIIFDEHNDVPLETDFDSPYARPEIDRSDLRDLLLDSLEPGTVVWDSNFLHIIPNGIQLELNFDNGTTALADIVIGADGGNSKIRTYVTHIKANYAGITILQGNVMDAPAKAPRIWQLLQGGKIYVHANGKYLHISAKGDESIDFYISSKMDEGWVNENVTRFLDQNQLMQWFKETFSQWGSLWFELFTNVDIPMLVRPQYAIPINQVWDTKSNLTVLGDAAHIMPPSGEGVNLAMLDAFELSQCLTSYHFNNLQEAINAYESNMQERAAKEVEVSLDMIEWMHGEDAQDRMINLFKDHSLNNESN